MRAFTLILSHPYKEMRERTTKQAEGKEPPSLGSGGPSLTAVGLAGEMNRQRREQRRKEENEGR
jgi:hypothetical protein